MIGLIMTIVGIGIFILGCWINSRLVKVNYYNKDLKVLVESVADMGFWLTFLGIIILIWG